jgi:hypothetical protein
MYKPRISPLGASALAFNSRYFYYVGIPRELNSSRVLAKADLDLACLGDENLFCPSRSKPAGIHHRYMACGHPFTVYTIVYCTTVQYFWVLIT